MSPSSYAPPTIQPSGLVISPFSAVLQYNVSQYLAIFGSNVYLGNDSSDFQDISIRALQAADYQAVLQALYLSFDPLTAIGASLDLLGVLIGTARASASYSTVALTLTGTPFTQINNATAQDINGNYWTIAGQTVIGSDGTVIATAQAQTIGNITVGAGQVTIITNPTKGWTGVTNAANGSPGQPAEPDSHYRARLMISQAKPSLSLLAGSNAAVAAVPGVTRSVVYENYFDYTAGYGTVNYSGTAVTLAVGKTFDSTQIGEKIWINISGTFTSFVIASVGSGTALVATGLSGSGTGVRYYIGDGINIGPAHSITAVVEGGAANAIAQAIYGNKNPGCLTSNLGGSTTVQVSDPRNAGILLPISYYVLDYAIIYVAMNIRALNGYTSAVTAQIQAAIVNYLNNLGIGETVVYSQMYWAAASVQPNEEQPLFSIQSVTLGESVLATTATLNSTTTIVITGSATGIANGQTVVGAGIPPNTTVTDASGTPNIVISAAATATDTGVAVTFFATGTSDIAIGFRTAPGGDAANVVLTQV